MLYKKTFKNLGIIIRVTHAYSTKHKEFTTTVYSKRVEDTWILAKLNVESTIPKCFEYIKKYLKENYS